jgi:glucose/arabinose dehydrogenase
MSRSAAILGVASVALLAGAAPALAQPPGDGSGGVGLRQIGGFDHPVYVAAAPGFRRLLFVVEQPGRVKVIRNGHKLRRSFLNISGRVNYDAAERGLLSIAFPPDYRRTKRFYVYYNDAQGDIRVDEFRRSTPTIAAPGSRRSVLQIPHRANSNHNGGQLQFLGHLLYIATGDGGSAGDPPDNAQNRRVLLGKVLRIDPRNPRGKRSYSVPRSNPFVGRRGRNEIFSFGLRNPFRFSFDRVTAKRPRIVIGDVGQNAFEEVDYETLGSAAGANFGWDGFEGFAKFEPPFPRHTQKPIFAYSHAAHGGCAVIGGYVVRDRRLRSLYKRYLYSDNCDGTLRSFLPRLRRARGDRPLGLSLSAPTSFGEDNQGRVYVCSLEGPVYRLVPR